MSYCDCPLCNTRHDATDVATLQRVHDHLRAHVAHQTHLGNKEGVAELSAEYRRAQVALKIAQVVAAAPGADRG